MSFDRIGEDFFISGSVSAAAFYGDGSNLTGISAGGGGGLTGSGTANYIAKFTSAGVLANSNIQDDGYPNGVGINYAPQAGTILAIGNAVQPDTFYALNNYATSSTTRAGYFQNYGNPGTGPKIGVEVFVPTGANNYALILKDGREGANKVLTSDASGNAYWATPAGFIPAVSESEVFRGQTHRNNSTTIDTYGGVVTSTSASTQAQSVATTGFRHRSIKLRYYASVVSTGRYTGVRGSSQQFWSITGGFRYVCDFAISDSASSSSTQTFMGLAAQNTDLGYGGAGQTAVSTLTDLIGVGNDGTDTNLQIIHNDASGTATKIDLGANFPCQRTTADITAIYSVVIYNEPSSSDVKVQVTNKETGDIAQHTLTTDLPANTSLLNFFASRTMGTPVTNTGEFYLYKLGVYHLV